MVAKLLLTSAAHGAMPGASDEILAAAFLLFVVLAGWWILKHGS